MRILVSALFLCLTVIPAWAQSSNSEWLKLFIAAGSSNSPEDGYEQALLRWNSSGRKELSGTDILLSLGDERLFKGKFNQAVHSYTDALNSIERRIGKDSPLLLPPLYRLAAAYHDANMPKRSLIYFDRAVDIKRMHHIDGSRPSLFTEMSLGMDHDLMTVGRWKDAKTTLSTCLEEKVSLNGWSSNSNLLGMCAGLMRCCWSLKEPTEARRYANLIMRSKFDAESVRDKMNLKVAAEVHSLAQRTRDAKLLIASNKAIGGMRRSPLLTEKDAKLLNDFLNDSAAFYGVSKDENISSTRN